MSEHERETRELKARAMDEAPAGIVVTDPDQPDNPIVYANETFCRLTGYDRSEVLGRNCRFLQGTATRDEPIVKLQRAIENEEPVTVELRNYRKDGTMFWNEVRIRPVRDDRGEVVNYVGFQQDVTERTERQRAVRRKNERLDEFARVVSHDIRSPLTVADGRLDLARRECDSEHLDAIARAHERIQALTEDLLTVAREGTTATDAESVDLAAIVEECWNTVETAEAALVVETDRTIRADRTRLKQLLENLLRNAVRYGGSDVTATVGDLPDATGFFVEDDGPGLPEDDRDRIFEAGYSSSQGNTGFGLSIVRGIVDAHGWAIEATDAAGGGARFEITGVDVEE